eukprot:TRINITY_DN96519_c0_g1_i1.p1 TRINITY_DN96519_c0_g1~~TRINITY_DN96519_c0_g1_i1.p1  ORF type:complete len:150 (-),score=14.57 TRINITY_DN96519_c0_g1_i1:89-538(-)
MTVAHRWRDSRRAPLAPTVLTSRRRHCLSLALTALVALKLGHEVAFSSQARSLHRLVGQYRDCSEKRCVVQGAKAPQDVEAERVTLQYSTDDDAATQEKLQRWSGSTKGWLRIGGIAVIAIAAVGILLLLSGGGTAPAWFSAIFKGVGM